MSLIWSFNYVSFNESCIRLKTYIHVTNYWKYNVDASPEKLLIQFIVGLVTDRYAPILKMYKQKSRLYVNVRWESFLDSSSEDWEGCLLTMHKVTPDLYRFFFNKIEGCEEESSYFEENTVITELKLCWVAALLCVCAVVFTPFPAVTSLTCRGGCYSWCSAQYRADAASELLLLHNGTVLGNPWPAEEQSAAQARQYS